MNTWHSLTSLTELEELTQASYEQAVIIFKHSTTCPVSSIAKMRLADQWDDSKASIYYLDLLRYRSVSNKIAELFNVQHESPQALVIRNGECIYNSSHLNIQAKDIAEELV